jgi:pimeloyl-ACP methyl ester carboxylesterase
VVTARLPADFRPPTPVRRLTLHRPDGVRLAVQVHGPDDVPVVVLSHGWTCSATFWTRVTHRLLTDRRVVVYDQRGHGRSSAVPAGGFTTAALAGDLAAVLTATVPAGRRAVVAGHSMGGMSLVAMAGAEPDTLRRTVSAALLASTGMDELVGRMSILPHPAEPGDRWLTIAQRLMTEPHALHGLPLPLARAAATWVTLSGKATRAEREFNADILLACPPVTYRGFALMLGALDLADELARFDVPAMVLVGTHDRLTPPWHAHRTADALPRPLGLLELQGHGHMTPLTAPDATADTIRRLAAASVESSPAAPASAGPDQRPAKATRPPRVEAR